MTPLVSIAGEGRSPGPGERAIEGSDSFASPGALLSPVDTSHCGVGMAGDRGGGTTAWGSSVRVAHVILAEKQEPSCGYTATEPVRGQKDLTEQKRNVPSELPGQMTCP